MAVEVEKNEDGVSFLDPECFSKPLLLSTSHPFCVFYTKRAYQLYAKKRVFISAYNTKSHWILLKQNRVLYLDSWKSLETDISHLTKVIDE
jgi:hypothetical protein